MPVPVALPNLYYKRTAATAKACYICYKPTTVVLATIDTADFFYTCPVHLTDRGFATRAADPEPEPKEPSVSPAEIARVKQEWEEKQRQKKDKEKEKAQGKQDDQADGDGKDDSTTDGAQKAAEEKEANVGAREDSQREKKPPSASASPPAEPASPRPTHERYVLHRDIFALRTADRRRRRNAAQAKDLAPRLPGAPRSSLT